MPAAVTHAPALREAMRMVEMACEPYYTPAASMAKLTFGADSHATATDNESELTVRLDAQTETPFTALFHPQDVVTMLGNARGTAVVDTNNTFAFITAGTLKHTSLANQATEFPEMKIGAETGRLEITGRELREALNMTRFAISNEETRYYLNGIYLTHKDGKLRLVATDGHRLSMYDTQVAYTGPSGIIPRKSVNILCLLPMTDDEAVTVTLSKKPHSAKNIGPVITFLTDAWTLKVSCIDGTYPDYQKVIPAPSEQIRITITQAMASAIPYGPHRDRSRHAVFQPDEGKMTVKTETGEELLSTPLRGHGQPFSIHPRYVRQMASVLGQIELTAKACGEPLVGSSKRYPVTVVQMPMKTTPT